MYFKTYRFVAMPGQLIPPWMRVVCALGGGPCNITGLIARLKGKAAPLSIYRAISVLMELGLVAEERKPMLVQTAEGTKVAGVQRVLSLTDAGRSILPRVKAVCEAVDGLVGQAQKR